MLQLTHFELKVHNRLGELLHKNELSDNFMVETLKLLEGYANLSSVKTFADRHNLTPQGVLKCRKVFKLAGFNVITDPQ